jgi:DNA polymerase III sliding clamp (beta) subunit (PCNA family)
VPFIIPIEDSMAFEIRRSELLESLGLVEPGLSARGYIEQSTCYVFMHGWVTTFNDEISCRARSGLPKEFTGAVNAKKLREVLDKIPDEIVKIDFRETEIVVKAKRKEAGIRLQREILLPVDDVTEPEKEDWWKVPDGLKDAIEKAAGAAGTNDEEFLTVCLNIHPDFIEGSDRFQSCRYHVKTGVEEPFLVRAKSVIHVAKIDPVKMGTTAEWVHFRNDRLIFSCRRIMDDFYDLDDEFAFKGKKATLPENGEVEAKLTAVFCEGKDNDKLRVKITDNQMVVRGQDDGGWATVNLGMEYKGPEVSFRILPDMLNQLIKDNRNCEIGPRKLCVRGDNWVYVTTLVTPDEADDERKPVAVGAAEEEEDGDDDTDD